MADNKEVAKVGNQTPAAVEPPPQTDIAKASNQLENLADVQKMVLQYSARIVGQERAREFATHVAIMAKQDPKIAQCDPVSVLKGMMACVRLDMMPNTPEQYVALIPYGKELQFQVMYRGLTQLAYNSGIVNKIDAELVFPEDIWEIEQGTERKLIHKMTAESLNRDRTKADEALFAYATAVMNTGERAFQVMTQSEIKQIKTQSVKANGNDTPWSRWPAEQYKKTVVKRFTKLLPKSSEDNRLAYAVQLDNLAEAGKLNVDEHGDVIEGEVVAKEDATRRRIEAAQAKRQTMQGNGHVPKAVKSTEDAGDGSE